MRSMLDGYPDNYQISSWAQALPLQAAPGARQACMCRCAEAAREGQMSLRRREFIAGLGGAAAWPLAARAQQRPIPIIGFLAPVSNGSALSAALYKRLMEVGYVEGQNIKVEYRG